MFEQGTPHRTRRGHGLTIAMALIAFLITAVGLTAAIRAVDEEAGAASPPAATATDHAGHAHATAAATQAETAVDAPKNLNNADVPAYRPGVQVVDWDMTEKVVEIAPGKVV